MSLCYERHNQRRRRRVTVSLNRHPMTGRASSACSRASTTPASGSGSSISPRGNWCGRERRANLFGLSSEHPVSFDHLPVPGRPGGPRPRRAGMVQRAIESGDNFDVELPGRRARPAAATGCGPAAAWSGSRRHRRAICAASCSTSTMQKQLEEALRLQQEPSPLDPRDRAGRDDRDRRPRHHAVLLQRRRAAVRLSRSAKRSARTSAC